MTVSSTAVRISYAGDGTTNAWPFPYPFISASDLLVIRRNTDGSETTLTIATNYTVTGDGNPAGGSVTPVAATVIGATYVIIRNPAATQNFNVDTGSAIPAASLNLALDKIVLVLQRAFDLITRSLRLRETDTNGSGAYDANGNRISNAGAATTSTDLVTLGAVQTLFASIVVPPGAAGNNGWSPVFAVITDTTRRVLQVMDWVGGQGTKPTTGLYVGAAGLTATLASAVDIRGAAGAGTGDMIAANNLSDVTSITSARNNLGLGALAVLATINGGNWSGTDLAVADGGTGASTAAAARTNLGLATVAATGLFADLGSKPTTISGYGLTDAEALGQRAGINTQTGTAYTLVLGDKGKMVEMNNASSNTLTVPPNSSVAFPINSWIDVSQYGAGQTAIAPGAGVTIRSSGSKLKLTGQYSAGTLVKRATDEWWLIGDITT